MCKSTDFNTYFSKAFFITIYNKTNKNFFIINKNNKNKMPTQIFRNLVPKELLFSLLERICLKTDKYFLIDSNAYKKLLFYNLHTELADSLKPYYHLGKYYYIERKMTYNAFITIIRQICKASAIMYSSSMKYNRSNYSIEYLVYF